MFKKKTLHASKMDNKIISLTKSKMFDLEIFDQETLLFKILENLFQVLF